MVSSRNCTLQMGEKNEQGRRGVRMDLFFYFFNRVLQEGSWIKSEKRSRKNTKFAATNKLYAAIPRFIEPYFERRSMEK